MRQLILSLLFLFACVSAAAGGADSDRIMLLRETADSLHAVGRTDSAAIVGRRAIELAEKSGDAIQIVGTHAAQGVFLRSLGKIDEALASYDAALKIITSGEFRENPTQEAIEEIASLYINLAVLNLDMQHKEPAAANALLAGEWIAKSNDAALRSTIYGVAGSVLTACGNLDEAMRFQSLAYGDALTVGDTEAAFRAAAYTMLIADRLGDKAQARKWRNECNKLLPQVQSTMARLVYYQAECSIYLANGDPEGSIVWFNKILELDGIDNLPFVKFDCYNNLHSAYAAMGDYSNAYSTVLKSNELRDSLWQQEKAESLRDLTVKYETKETELALARSEASKARTLMWLAAVAVLLVLTIAGFMIYAGRQRRRRMQKEMEMARLRADIGQQLTRQYIEGLENERHRMSAELHDGVCNDLLAIEMNISAGKPIESTASMIASCREAVRRISHELMPPEFAYATIDEVVRYYVTKQAEACAGKIVITYSSSATGANWQDVPDITALEIYRIIQETTGNAIKHSGATEIKLRMALDGSLLTAEVSDNGNYRPGRRKGIGLESVRRRANSINGEIEIESSENSGTSMRLSVKI